MKLWTLTCALALPLAFASCASPEESAELVLCACGEEMGSEECAEAAGDCGSCDESKAASSCCSE